MTPSPTVLHSHSPADLLATLPTLLGCRVHDSLVVVPFRRRRTAGALRIDRPDDRSGHAAVADIAVASLSRMAGCDGAVLVVYADKALRSARRPADELTATVARRLRAAGFQVIERLCVASDGWARLDEAGARSRPLTQIESSPLSVAAADARGGTVLPALADAGDLPAVSDRVVAATSRLTRSLRVDPDTLPFDDPSAFLESLLAQDPADVPQEDLARLCVLSLRHAERDAALLQIAFGQRCGTQMRAFARRQNATHTLAGPAAPDPDGMTELFLGASARVPSWARLRAGVDILRRAVASHEPDLRPDLLCMLAWLQWALGHGTAAGRHLDRSRRIRRDHAMTDILSAVVSNGMVPEWMYVAHSAAAADMA